MPENLTDIEKTLTDAKRKPPKTEPVAAKGKKDVTTTEIPVVTPEPQIEETPYFKGCNTCVHFGNYPSWEPCANCKRNPKNQGDYYTT